MGHGNTVTDVTPARQKVLDAIDAGHTTLDAIADAAGIASKTTVRTHLQCLARDGHIGLIERGGRLYVDGGLRDYAKGWDAAARAMGNPDA